MTLVDETKFERLISRLEIPDQPRQEHRRGLWQRMLEAFEAAQKRYEKAGPLRRRWMALSTPGHVLHGRGRRTMALIFLAVALGMVIVLLVLGMKAAWGSMHGGFGKKTSPLAITWTELLDHIRDERTIRFKMTVEDAGGGKSTYLLSVLRPQYVRIVDGDWIEIIDRQYNKVLTLFPRRKTYILSSRSDLPPQRRVPRILTELRSLDSLSGHPANTAQDEQPVFVASGANAQWTIRVDMQTEHPSSIRYLNSSSGEAITLSDMEWGPKLDENDFRLAPPAGYTQERQEK